MLRFLLIAALTCLALSRSYPLYKQCDDRWRNEQLGTSSNTICSAGCLMSSAAMALSGIGKNYNPSTLNTWLKGNGGYVSGDLFVWASINSLGLTFLGKTSRAQIKANLNSDNIVILNVHNGGHWVLATGTDGTNFQVNDPGYSTTSYTYDQIVENQVGIYKVGSGFVNFMIGEIEAMFNVGRRNRLIEADRGQKIIQ